MRRFLAGWVGALTLGLRKLFLDAHFSFLCLLEEAIMLNDHCPKEMTLYNVVVQSIEVFGPCSNMIKYRNCLSRIHSVKGYHGIIATSESRLSVYLSSGIFLEWHVDCHMTTINLSTCQTRATELHLSLFRWKPAMVESLPRFREMDCQLREMAFQSVLCNRWINYTSKTLTCYGAGCLPSRMDKK